MIGTIGIIGLIASISIGIVFVLTNAVLETVRGKSTILWPLSLICVAMAYLFLPMALMLGKA